MRNERQKGTGLVEVVIAAAIITLVVLGLMSAFTLHFRIGLDTSGRIQGALLAEEGVEAFKFLRDESWTNRIAPLSTATTYYLATTSTGWEATTTKKTDLGKFVRTAVLNSVNRDASGFIVSSGGTTDSGTRQIVITVSWPTASGTTTRSITTYLTNLYSN